MWQNLFMQWQYHPPFLGALFFPFVWILFAVLAVWSVIWKGMALWKAARRSDTVWFVALLVVNTLGILEILYLYVFSKDKTVKANNE